MNLLVYARPWNKEQFIDLASKAWPNSPIVLTSEHPSVDKSGLFKRFYDALGSLDRAATKNYLDELQLDDVIHRCRLLRAIDRSFAIKLVSSMEAAIEHVLDQWVPDVMLSITVDSYVLHLFSLACDRRSIPFIGLIPTFVNDYFRVTTLGEKAQPRRVSDEECQKVLSTLLQTDYKPNFLAKNSKGQRKKIIKLWAKNVPKPLWFYLKRFVTRDRYNYHYFSTQIVAKHYWSFLPKSYKGSRPVTIYDLKSTADSKPIIFFPLQMSPEATVDYWSEDADWVEYETKVLSLIDQLSSNYNVVIKEHPNIVGYRTKSFYRKLESLQRARQCILIDPVVNSNIILGYVDAVVLCTGSIGFEAAIRGVPVYSDAKPFLLPAEKVNPIDSLVDGQIQSKEELSSDSKSQLVRYLLEGLLPGKFVNAGGWVASLNSQENMAESLRSYFNHMST